MRKLITILLWLVVFVLLGVYAYQKFAWKELTSWVVISSYTSFKNNFKTSTCVVISKIQNKLCGFMTQPQTWRDNKSYITSQDPRWSLLSAKVMENLDRNQQFSDNLIQINQTPSQIVWKDGVLATLQTSSNHISDSIQISKDGIIYSYPARYNFDNIYAYKTSNPEMIYTTDGLNFLDKEMLYYEVKNILGNQKIYFLNTSDGITQSLDHAVPFLFFKWQYIFTTKPWDLYHDLYVYKSGKISKFADQIVSEINIDKDLISIYDPDDREIVFYNVVTLLPQYKIDIDRMSIEYLSFLEDGEWIWIRYKDNLTDKIIHERHHKSTIIIDDNETSIYGIKITDVEIWD